MQCAQDRRHGGRHTQAMRRRGLQRSTELQRSRREASLLQSAPDGRHGGRRERSDVRRIGKQRSTELQRSRRDQASLLQCAQDGRHGGRREQANQDGCSARPNFNVPGETRPRFCNAHKTEGMVDVVSKRCAQEGCSAYPSFNVPGDEPRFCRPDGRHGGRREQAVCAGGVSAHPSFNVPAETRPRFCKAHKTEGMVDVVSKRCAQEGCSAIPSFNVPGEKPRFCNAHKTEGMVDVKHKRCDQDGCSAQPSFNVGARPGLAFARRTRPKAWWTSRTSGVNRTGAVLNRVTDCLENQQPFALNIVAWGR